jgi:HEPN domain-containing protein
MVKKPPYQHWLKEADKDFRYASWTLKNAEENFYSFILFHLQQAAEKYLKAFIIFKNLPFKKIHELPELVEIIKTTNESFAEIEEEATFLNDFYVDTRYPVYWPAGHTKEIALKAEEAAKTIGDFVKEKIG